MSAKYKIFSFDRAKLELYLVDIDNGTVVNFIFNKGMISAIFNFFGDDGKLRSDIATVSVRKSFPEIIDIFNNCDGNLEKIYNTSTRINYLLDLSKINSI